MSKIRDFFIKLKNSKLLTIQAQNEEEINQYDYGAIMQYIKDTKVIDEFFLEMDKLKLEEHKYYPSKVHGIEHTSRVMLLATILTKLDDISPKEKRLIITAARYHDIGRIDDTESKEHGQYGKDKIENEKLLEEFSKSDRKIIEFAIEQHSLSKEENQRALEKLPFWQREKYSVVLNYLKDADALDRVRIANKSAQLDPNRLRSKSAKQLVDFSYKNFQEFPKIMSEYKVKLIEKQGDKFKQSYELIKDSILDIDWILENKDYLEKLYNRGILQNLKNTKESFLDFIEQEELVEIADEIESSDFEEIIKSGYNITYMSFLEIVSSYQKGTLEELRKQGKLNELFSYETYKKYAKEENFKERIKKIEITDHELLSKINANATTKTLKETFYREYMLYKNLYQKHEDAFNLLEYSGIDMDIKLIIGNLQKIDLTDLNKVREFGYKISINELIRLSSKFSPEEYREIMDYNQFRDLFVYDADKEPNYLEYKRILEQIQQMNPQISEEDFFDNYEAYKQIYYYSDSIYDIPEMKKYQINEIYPAVMQTIEAQDRLKQLKGKDIQFNSKTIINLMKFLRKH